MVDDEVQTKSRKDLRREVDDAEKKFQGYVARRNEFNDKARQMRDDRDLLHNRRKEIMTEVNALRTEKDKALGDLRKHKERRDTLHKQAKKIIEMKRSKHELTKGESLSTDLFALKDTMRKLEYTQQTTPLTMEKERELIDQIKEGYSAIAELEKEYATVLEINSEVETLDGSLDTLFKEADSEHQLVVKYYEATRKLQEKMDDIYREVRHLISEADKKHTAFIDFRKKADSFHEKASEMRGKLNEIRKEGRENAIEARKLIGDQNKAARSAVQNKELMDEKLDEALEQLLKKGKISL